MKSRKFLFVQLGRIGDFVLMTPMFASIKNENPEHKIHVLVSGQNMQIAEHHPLIDRTFVYTKKLFQTLHLIANLNKEKYDHWIDAKDHFSGESYYFALFSNATNKTGFNKPGKKIVFSNSILSDKQQMDLHLIERNLAVLSQAGINHKIKNMCPVLFTKQESEDRLIQFIQKHSIKDYFCINISATSQTRYWQNEKWIKFVIYLSGKLINTIIIAAPGDFSLAEEIATQTESSHFYRTDTIIDVLSVIKNSNIVITPDTSIVHISAAFDRPIVALFSNRKKNITKFYPRSTHSLVITNPVSNALVPDIEYDYFIDKFDSFFITLNG